MMGIDHWLWSLDGWIICAAILCAVSSALLGNFLVLRKLSMLGDAISHAVLPGLAAAFMITGSRDSLPMFLGAVAAGIATALLTEWIRGSGNVDEGAAMGVVFTSLFALGLVLIVQVADHVDIDPGCVLYGSIELTPLDTWIIAGRHIPRVVVILSSVLIVNILFVTCFYKELKLTSFDPGLATSQGFTASIMHYLLMALVAVTAVASFESVGNILVVAMFVVPPATALMFTDRLIVMITLSVLFAVAAAVLGHLSALAVPTWFGFRSTTTTGMIALAIGLLFLLSAMFAPKHGAIIRWLRQARLSWHILGEDIVALLYRIEEKLPNQYVDIIRLQELLMCRPQTMSVGLWRQKQKGLVEVDANRVRLTSTGRELAQGLVRSHRLWENYLVVAANVPVDRIHQQAEQLEHFTNKDMRDRLDSETPLTDVDPHGSPIPPEAEVKRVEEGS
jgi:manganese/zinc/iron transport system permease protein